MFSPPYLGCFLVIPAFSTPLLASLQKIVPLYWLVRCSGKTFSACPQFFNHVPLCPSSPLPSEQPLFSSLASLSWAIISSYRSLSATKADLQKNKVYRTGIYPLTCLQPRTVILFSACLVLKYMRGWARSSGHTILSWWSWKVKQVSKLVYVYKTAILKLQYLGMDVNTNECLE